MAGKFKKQLSFLLAAALVFCGLPMTAYAVNIALNTSDAGGINSAVSTVDGSSDAENSININPGTYDKTNDINNSITFSNKKLTIHGNGSPESVIIDCQNTASFLLISGNSNITLENLTIKNGNGRSTNLGGAIDILGGGAITITDCVFNGNAATATGGALNINCASTVAITDSVFSNNSANFNGGAIYNNGGTVTITDCTFTGNSAASGGIYNNSGTVSVNYGSVVDGIEGSGTTEFEVVFGVTGSGGSLTATAGGFSITTGNFVESGSATEFSASPLAGYRVKQWTVTQWADSQSSSNASGNDYSVASLNSPYKVMVEFEDSTTPSQPTGQTGQTSTRRRSSGSGQAYAPPAAAAPQDFVVDATKANSALEEKEKSGAAKARIRHNGEIKVLAEAWKTFGKTPVNFDTADETGVQVRVTIPEPGKMTGDKLLSGYVKGSAAENRKAHFEKYFTNKLRVIHLDQQADWGQPVEIAAKLDLAGMDTKNLYFYSYDSKTNKYKRIENPAYRIDENGFLHFTTKYAGDIIVSDGPLEKKA